MNPQIINSDVITSYRQSSFLIKLHLKVEHNQNQLMRYVAYADKFLDLFLKVDKFPKSLSLNDIVEFLEGTKLPDLEVLVCEISELNYPITAITHSEIMERNNFLFKTMTMLFDHSKGYNIEFSGLYIINSSGSNVILRKKEMNNFVIFYTIPEAVDLEYYVEESSFNQSKFEFLDVERLEVTLNFDGVIMTDSIHVIETTFFKNKLKEVLHIKDKVYECVRKNIAMQRNYNDFEYFIYSYVGKNHI